MTKVMKFMYICTSAITVLGGITLWSIDYMSYSVLPTVIIMILGSLLVLIGLVLLAKAVLTPSITDVMARLGTVSDLSEEEMLLYVNLGNLVLKIYNDDDMTYQEKVNEIEVILETADLELLTIMYEDYI